ncbi:MAG: hypothetical protein LC640_06280, partial [Frankia sp.]|nr:hypothetical protein [Frankia sp.]
MSMHRGLAVVALAAALASGACRAGAREQPPRSTRSARAGVGCAAAPRPGRSEHTMLSGGIRRRYLVDFPEVGPPPYPIVLAMHG